MAVGSVAAGAAAARVVVAGWLGCSPAVQPAASSSTANPLSSVVRIVVRDTPKGAERFPQQAQPAAVVVMPLVGSLLGFVQPPWQPVQVSTGEGQSNGVAVCW